MEKKKNFRIVTESLVFKFIQFCFIRFQAEWVNECIAKERASE